MSERAYAPSQATGYTVVLPPGWCRIPVRYGSSKAIRSVVSQALRSLPGSVPTDRVAPYRAELEARLRAMVTQARNHGGMDIYLPAEPMHGVPVAASFVVSEGSYGAGADGADPDEMLAYLAAGQDGSTVMVSGTPALRREHSAAPEQDAELDAGTRRVDYVLPVPGRQGRWLVAAFSTMGGGDPDDELSSVLVQLFDAIMSTFRWSR